MPNYKTVEIIGDPNRSSNLVQVRDSESGDEFWTKRTSLRRDTNLGVWILLSERQLNLIEAARTRKRRKSKSDPVSLPDMEQEEEFAEVGE